VYVVVKGNFRELSDYQFLTNFCLSKGPMTIIIIIIIIIIINRFFKLYKPAERLSGWGNFQSCQEQTLKANSTLAR